MLKGIRVVGNFDKTDEGYLNEIKYSENFGYCISKCDVVRKLKISTAVSTSNHPGDISIYARIFDSDIVSSADLRLLVIFIMRDFDILITEEEIRKAGKLRRLADIIWDRV